jgi:4-amino-4-deoxy-L-arabinose transferase-like glycosyltransferase
MTMPPRPHRNRAWADRAALAAVVALAAWLRLDGVDFGLPALNDPDEPLFIMTAFDMLRNGTADPGWFGHPGTTTLYCLALIFALVGAVGSLTGRFDGADGFAAAVFADPAIVVLPARLFIVLCGLVCVLLTYAIGRRLWGRNAGLCAAAILAVNALHIAYSQVIRTDMQASVFMLLCVLQSLTLLKLGRTRDYVIAGVLVGLACATKWPAAAIALSPICAGLWRLRDRPTEVRHLLLFGAVSVACLFAVSPFLLIDHAAVLRDLAGEARPAHPGATGHGFVGNLAGYVSGPLLGSFGTAGLGLTGIGLLGAMRDKRWAIAVAPGFVLFALLITTQHLIWDRWLVPLLPFLALAAAWTVRMATGWLVARTGPRGAWLALPALALLLWPMVSSARTMAAERKHDTRQIASAWLRAHVPPGRSILVEHGALDLFSGPWDIRFPLGAAGCIDARQALAGRVTAADVERNRKGRAIVDIGHVEASLLATCRTDYAVLSHWEKYRADPETNREQLLRYRELTAGGRIEVRITPIAGRTGGPIVHIVKLTRGRVDGPTRNDAPSLWPSGKPS